MPLALFFAQRVSNARWMY